MPDGPPRRALMLLGSEIDLPSVQIDLPSVLISLQSVQIDLIKLTIIVPTNPIGLPSAQIDLIKLTLSVPTSPTSTSSYQPPDEFGGNLAAIFTSVFTPRKVEGCFRAFSSTALENLESLCFCLHSQYTSRPCT